jgi:hypothetical protein
VRLCAFFVPLTYHLSPAFAALRRGRLITFLLVLLSTISYQPSAFSQGSLTPPGAPAPTFKTLQQIEPRIDLQNAPASAVTTDANYHFIINQPGSYYLSANLGVTKTNGIQINAEGVTLDLNGFQISRASGSGGTGIQIPATSHRASVRSGSIKGFDNGINSLFAGARGCAFRDLAVSACAGNGILTGGGAVLESCRAHDNSGNYGISASEGSSLTNCTASNNTVISGISAGQGSSLTNCTASNNTGFAGISTATVSSLTNCTAYNNTADYGIHAGPGCSLANCSAYANSSAASTSAGIGTAPGCTITHCTSSSNLSTASASTSTGMGIDADTGVTIKDCTTTSNKGDGILVVSSCLVTGCTSSLNGVGSPFGDGIRSNGDSNRIDGNLVVGNSLWGIRTTGTSVVVRNTATGNGTANYNVSTGTNIGPIQTPGTATSPWANF